MAYFRGLFPCFILGPPTAMHWYCGFEWAPTTMVLSFIHPQALLRWPCNWFTWLFAISMLFVVVRKPIMISDLKHFFPTLRLHGHLDNFISNPAYPLSFHGDLTSNTFEVCATCGQLSLVWLETWLAHFCFLGNWPQALFVRFKGFMAIG